MVAAGLPFGGALHHPPPDHVEVDVDKAARQMLARLNRSGVVAILPEGPPASLSLVVTLPRPAGDELQAAGNLALRSVANQEMNVVAGNGVVQDAEPVAFARLVQPPHPRSPVSGELQKELLAMAALRDVPDVAGKVVAIGA